LAVALAYSFFAKAPFDVDGYMYWGQTFWTWWSSGHLPIIRTPGFPVLIALNDHFGLGEKALKLEQCLALASGCVSTSWIAGHIARSTDVSGDPSTQEARTSRARWVAALLFATNVPLLSYASTLLTEAISIPLSLAAIVLTLKAIDSPRKRRAFTTWSATLLTITTLIRPMMVLHLAAAAVALLVSSPRKQRATLALRFAVPVIILFGPWVGRNLAMLGSAQPLGNVSQLNLAYGTHLPYDDALGETAPFDRDDRFFNNKRPDGFNPEQARVVNVKSELIANVKSRPFELLRSRMFAQLQLWGWPVTARTEEGMREEIPYTLLHAQHLFVLAFGGVGLWLARSTRGAQMIATIVAGTAAVHLLFHATPRFALPTLPMLFATSGVALSFCVERLKRRVSDVGRSPGADAASGKTTAERHSA
jgi:hypothetical protein